jgi:hypothetical protein
LHAGSGYFSHAAGLVFNWRSKLNQARLPGIDSTIGLAFEERRGIRMLDGGERTTELVIGAQRLCELVPAIRELRQHCGQQDDLTTDPNISLL